MRVLWLIRRRAAKVGAGAAVAALLITTGAMGINGQRAAIGVLRPVAGRHGGHVITAVRTAAPEVAITFDDGPDPTYTPAVLAVLRRFGVVATFFVLGSQAERYPFLAKQVVAEGSQVCNHGYAHQRLSGRSAAFVRQNLARAAAVLARIGLPHCSLFRFPYFLSDATARATVHAMGYRIVAAGCDSADYQRPPSTVIARRVLGCVQPGSIILFHDAGGDRRRTITALGQVLAGLRARGLRPVTLGRLLETGARTLSSGGVGG